jgi:eukaryotic-like serine/threonine-protein kinase
VLRAMAKAPESRPQSAADLQSALLAVDLRAGEATAVVAAPPRPAPAARPRADHTPPRGVPPTIVRNERRWMVPTVAIVAIALTLGVVGFLFARSDTGRSLIDDIGEGQGAAAAIPKPTPLAFDPPPGSGVEHDDELPFLVDGDPTSAWSTENYNSSRFGGLKPGVGVILQLSGSHKLGELEMTSPIGGWSAEVLVAASPQSTRAAWGEPVAAKRSVDRGTTTFDLGDRTAGAVLLWITDLGQGNSSVSIGELTLG